MKVLKYEWDVLDDAGEVVECFWRQASALEAAERIGAPGNRPAPVQARPVPVATPGLAVACGGTMGGERIVKGDPDPSKGLYAVTEEGALYVALYGSHLRFQEINGEVVGALASQFPDLPEISLDKLVTAEEAVHGLLNAAIAPSLKPGAGSFNDWEHVEVPDEIRRLLAGRSARKLYRL
jgi:hypothetical protein